MNRTTSEAASRVGAAAGSAPAMPDAEGSSPAARDGGADAFVLTLLALFAAFWTWLAIAPVYRQDWWLENVLVFAALAWLAWSAPRLRLSHRACGALFVFFCLHAVGAHYTYAEVPYDRWAFAFTGRTLGGLLGLERNDYDRAVHFAYGLLVTPAAIELLDARAPQRGIWRWLLPVSFMMSHAVLYELAEWLAAEVFGGDLGQAYLGTQGDVWDAQKDSAMAALGAAIAAGIVRAAHGAAVAEGHARRRPGSPARRLRDRFSARCSRRRSPAPRRS